MTNSEMIRLAFLSAGVLADGIPMTAEHAAEGLQTLNEMMSEWHEDGIEIGWFAQTNVAHDLPIYDDAQGPVRYNLAVRLAGNYEGAQISPFVLRQADEGYNRLLADGIDAQMKPVDMRHLGVAERSRIEQG